MQITRKILATMSWKPETFPAIKLLNFNFGMLIDVKLTLRSHSFPHCIIALFKLHDKYLLISKSLSITNSLF